MADMRQPCLALDRQSDAPALTHEQPRADQALQIGDALADCGLRQVDLFGSRGKAASAARSLESANPFQRQIVERTIWHKRNDPLLTEFIDCAYIWFGHP